MVFNSEFHPSTFIREEAEARGWTFDALASRMGGDAPSNRVALDLYEQIGPSKTNMRLGADTAAMLGHAFGISARYFLKLESLWLAKMKVNDDWTQRQRIPFAVLIGGKKTSVRLTAAQRVAFLDLASRRRITTSAVAKLALAAYPNLRASDAIRTFIKEASDAE